jgi:peptidylprolyl isomerase
MSDNRTATSGDTVHVHYTGRLDDGTQFDSSAGREPLSFTLGAGQVVKGFDDAVDGMEVGETKTVRMPAAQAYGERDERMTVQVPREQMPQGAEPQVGMQLMIQLQNGQQLPVTIVDVTEDSVTLDGNHALAGEALTFDLELVEIG